VKFWTQTKTIAPPLSQSRLKFFFTPLVLVCISISAFSADERPKDGFVPDAETAIKIATAVWGRIYSHLVSLSRKSLFVRILRMACGRLKVHFRRTLSAALPMLRSQKLMAQSYVCFTPNRFLKNVMPLILARLRG
jgi:hypothetical protein